MSRRGWRELLESLGDDPPPPESGRPPGWTWWGGTDEDWWILKFWLCWYGVIVIVAVLLGCWAGWYG